MTNKAKEKTDSLMELVREFEASWSLIGGRFDNGDQISQACVLERVLRAEIYEALMEFYVAGTLILTTYQPNVSLNPGNGDTLKPCPFCGESNVSVIDGSTFRWRLAQCNCCGASTGFNDQPLVRSCSTATRSRR